MSNVAGGVRYPATLVQDDVLLTSLARLPLYGHREVALVLRGRSKEGSIRDDSERFCKAHYNDEID